MFTWGRDNTAALIKLWNDGYSITLIGRQLGISRSAAMGKVRRLELPMRPTAVAVTKLTKPTSYARRIPHNYPSREKPPSKKPPSKKPPPKEPKTQSQLKAMLAEAVRNTLKAKT